MLWHDGNMWRDVSLWLHLSLILPAFPFFSHHLGETQFVYSLHVLLLLRTDSLYRWIRCMKTSARITLKKQSPLRITLTFPHLPCAPCIRAGQYKHYMNNAIVAQIFIYHPVSSTYRPVLGNWEQKKDILNNLLIHAFSFTFIVMQPNCLLSCFYWSDMQRWWKRLSRLWRKEEENSGSICILSYSLSV